tara:strand:- start:18 stop:200 length:183 start_codon:yes stop_codon:yes gene_type:complete
VAVAVVLQILVLVEQEVLEVVEQVELEQMLYLLTNTETIIKAAEAVAVVAQMHLVMEVQV